MCNALPEFLLRKAAQKYQTLRNSKGISRTKVSEIFQISRGGGGVCAKLNKFIFATRGNYEG
jgi:hypothetical protein